MSKPDEETSEAPQQEPQRDQEPDQERQPNQEPQPDSQKPASERPASASEVPLASDAEVYRRALLVLGLGVVILAAMVGIRGRSIAKAQEAPTPSVAEAPAPPPSQAPAKEAPAKAAQRLDQRVGRCGPLDPTAEDHFAEPRELSLGRAWIPKEGGHDTDFGYDVLIHFHGHKPARKIVQPFSDRLVYVGIDLGTLTGDYSKPLSNEEKFLDLQHSLRLALQKHSGKEKAHIRTLTISGWSAGVGAVPTLLKRFSADIDALILLDGLHAGWKLDKPTDGSASSVEPRYLSPVVAFAKQALAGEKRLVITHSEVPTEGYAPIRVTADRLLQALDLERQPFDPGADEFGRFSYVQQGGFTLWAHHGSEERGHCAQLVLLQDALEQRVLPWLKT
ncbi:MAG: hypothetical protein KC492_20815, partial [Myxococcales bacterium]|nr:hypothetical protein [Myxococcales bacterium]